jgi:hypothetical protein
VLSGAKRSADNADSSKEGTKDEAESMEKLLAERLL